MSNLYLVLLILSLFVASYIPRVIPMLYFSQRKVPEWFSEWMKFVPISLFAALVFKDVFISHEHFEIGGNIRILAMLLVAGVAYKTRSMAWSVIAGLAAVFLLSLV
ncbi:AzlD domain-containing protein [Enterococcus pallens]|uniref:Branched-chain amino acid transporter n=1 Tax=Enterococcus pallens ATCC BAA-351 TaxID=1158607 RepID=R2PVS1_9ENTE|nr:AzlD domain-containing protein [Enterococcus pallens]EOH87308.1 branched-chain amino acid transporter [Enterococcus pallens ATCC BAA-351]EOU18250.1 branched-chain amino acid transporter [Enterococcus pallens ATCC BAA-351]